MFTNRIKGNVPMGYQASISSTNVDDKENSPIWRMQTIKWKDPLQAQFLTSLNGIT